MAQATTKKASVKTTDEMTKELFQTVQIKKVALANAEKPFWNTSGMFGYSPNNSHDRIDIKTITDVRKLVEIYAFLTERENGYNEASSQLGVDKTFSWMGFSANEWKQDLAIRVDQLNFQTKRKEFNDLENRLNAILSPEVKVQMELEAISELLNEK